MKRKVLLWLFIVLLLSGLGIAYSGYTALRNANVSEEKLILIPSGSDFEDVLNILNEQKVLDEEAGFAEIAKLKKYPSLVKPGRYLIPKGFSNEELIDRLRAGDQHPVKLTFNSINTVADLAGKLAVYVESDSLAILQALMDPDRISNSGFSNETYSAAFVPNTYEVWWTVKPDELAQKLIDERAKFWKGKRRNRAKELNMTTQEVATLASIVRAETAVMKDAPLIAGVYLNRLRIGMPLQADPTLIFAMGRTDVKRVLDKDKEIDSPYNTYKYPGLPPGPINIPDPQYIDAVLEAGTHKYLYFCASADLGGTTVFAKTYGEHLRNARAYQRALNQQGTYR